MTDKPLFPSSLPMKDPNNPDGPPVQGGFAKGVWWTMECPACGHWHGGTHESAKEWESTQHALKQSCMKCGATGGLQWKQMGEHK